MKPRLNPAAATPDDRAIWLAMADRMQPVAGWFASVSFIYRDADRRDADLMWLAMHHHNRPGPLLHWSPEQPDYTYEYIWFGGAKVSELPAARHITYFA